jgi:hypothetical protein
MLGAAEEAIAAGPEAIRAFVAKLIHQVVEVQALVVGSGLRDCRPCRSVAAAVGLPVPPEEPQRGGSDA